MDKKLPVLVLKDIILFPNSEIRLELDNEYDRKIISLCEACYNKKVLVVNQTSLTNDSLTLSDIEHSGTIGQIIMRLDLPNTKTRVVIKGESRIEIDEFYEEDILYATYSKVIEPVLDDFEEVAYKRSLLKQLELYVNNVSYISDSILTQVKNIDNISTLTDLISLVIPNSYERRLEYLKEINPTYRVKMLLDDVTKELKVIDLEKKLDEKVTYELDKNQKDFILREKIKAIKQELGETNDKDEEVTSLREKVNNIHLPSNVKKRLLKEIKRYEITPITSPEVTIIKTYIDWLLNLPWNNTTKDNFNLENAKKILDDSHYGLNEAKSRIIEHLALKKFKNNVSSPIICLVGPPGVGKTSLALSVAKCMNRKTCKISVGGINDEAELVGHRKTYIGSAPGRIMQAIRKAKSKNPVFIIDEIDKMTKDIKGDPASALLDVLDKEQNKHFSDHYIEEEFDLRDVFFICTANYEEQIPLELYDRLEVIKINSYTEYEKLHIVKKYILKNKTKEYGLKQDQVTFSDSLILKIINNYTKEAGVRELERLISSILRKVIIELVEENDRNKKIEIEEKDIEKYLGKEKYSYNKTNNSEVGIVNGMSYTPCGGDILPIEATFYKGKSNINLTGMLGDVFKESAQISLSYIKSNYKKFDINYEIIENNDFHLHALEGAIKKDGPSAGIAITTALISSMTGLKIPSDISMTGEISLTGKVLGIGGLKEKVIGAKRANIKKIYLPKDNIRDLDSIDEEIKEGITFILVSNYEEVYKDLVINNDK